MPHRSILCRQSRQSPKSFICKGCRGYVPCQPFKSLGDPPAGVEVVPSNKPLDFTVRSIMIDVQEIMTDWEQFGEVMIREELEREVAVVRTMYKRKDRKVRPVNMPLPGG